MTTTVNKLVKYLTYDQLTVEQAKEVDRKYRKVDDRNNTDPRQFEYEIYCTGQVIDRYRLPMMGMTR